MTKSKEFTVLEKIKKLDNECLLIIFEAKKNKYKRYLANLILSSDEIMERSKIDWEYKSLTYWIEEEFVMNSFSNFWFYDYQKKKIHDRWHDHAMDAFSLIIWRTLWSAIDEGIIIYVKEGDRYRPANLSDSTYNFVHQLCTEGLLSSLILSEPPPWGQELFVNKHNLNAHREIWKKGEEDFPEFKKMRREAVWRETERLGGTLASLTSERNSETKDEVIDRWPWGSHTTRNLEHLEAAGKKFWINYDSSDPTTASTNAIVAKWLCEERGVSKSLADAMASILRDESLPTGPRK